MLVLVVLDVLVESYSLTFSPLAAAFFRKRTTNSSHEDSLSDSPSLSSPLEEFLSPPTPSWLRRGCRAVPLACSLIGDSFPTPVLLPSLLLTSSSSSDEDDDEDDKEFRKERRKRAKLRRRFASIVARDRRRSLLDWWYYPRLYRRALIHYPLFVNPLSSKSSIKVVVPLI